jgi:hypothetical protein
MAGVPNVLGRILQQPSPGPQTFRRKMQDIVARGTSRLPLLAPFASACVAAPVTHFISFEVGNLIDAF